jgi:hypothetical protein
MRASRSGPLAQLGTRKRVAAPRGAEPALILAGPRTVCAGKLALGTEGAGRVVLPDNPIILPSDNDRDSSAVRAPRRAGDVGGAFRTEEDDDRGDLLGPREPAQRPSGGDSCKDVVSLAALLIRKAALGEPRLRHGRARSHRVAPNRVLRIEIGNKPREGEHGGLRDGVVRHPRGGPLARRRRDVHYRAASATQMRQRGSDRTHIAHDVELPVRIPLLVSDLLEARVPCDAHIVDEDVQPAESRCCLGKCALWPAGQREVDAQVRDLSDTRRVPAAASHDSSAFGGEEPGDLEPDARRRPRHETRLAAESEIHEGG